MKAAINKYVFFPALLLGLGVGYTVLHGDREKIVGEAGTGSSLLRSFLGSSSHSKNTEVLPVLRKRQKIQEFLSGLTSVPARDWAHFLSLGEYDGEMQKALVEHWARHCPRQAWQFLDSPEFRKKYDGYIRGELKKNLLEAWMQSNPEEAWGFGESLLASKSDEDVRPELLGVMADFRGRQKTEDALEWVLSLPPFDPKEKGDSWLILQGERETALYELLSSRVQSGEEWAASLKKFWPRLQSSLRVEDLAFFAVKNLGREKAIPWMDSLSLSESDRKKIQEELAVRKVRSDLFDTDDNLTQSLSKLGENVTPERKGSVFFRICSSNEEELRQYAETLPDGVEKKQVFGVLSGYSKHMEYRERLDLLKGIPQEERGETLHRLYQEWRRMDPQDAALALEESTVLSEKEKQALSAESLVRSKVTFMSPGRMERSPFYEGQDDYSFYDFLVTFSDAAANVAPEK